MRRNYLTHKIATLYDPPKEKKRREYKNTIYSQTEAAKLMEIPHVFVRLLMDAGRLTAVDVPSKDATMRMVMLDSKEWHSARESWRHCVRQWNKQVSQG